MKHESEEEISRPLVVVVSSSSDPDEYDVDVNHLHSEPDIQETFSRIRRCKSENFRSDQYLNSNEIKICVGTWNAGGEHPPHDLDIDEWIDIDDPADIYVLGLQEIVPLNAGHIFGSEDTRPVKKWENIIRQTLKRVRHKTKLKSFSDPPTPTKFKPFEDNPDIEEEILLESDSDIGKEEMHPLDKDRNLDAVIKRRRRSSYVRILSKQMVGVFLTIWVRRSLRYHIQNVKVSTVCVGVMPYIGNKGSVSVSMSIYQTLFCFVCTHLTSGEKEENELKRNADVHAIHQRTMFRSMSGSRLPKSIYNHERIIWLGDLNYRLNLSYEKTKELISEKRWSKLLESDQLTQELRKGRAFDGWSEGKINFAPTYKYEMNSEKYYGEDPRIGRRTPAWCDRILSYGKGMKQLSYRRSELKFSDHRPVTAVYIAEVEVFCPRKLHSALEITDAETENDNVVFLKDDALSNRTRE